MVEYLIVVGEGQKYILMKLRGRITRSELIQQVVTANILGAEQGIQRYLVDMTDADRDLSTLDDYELVNKDILTDTRVNRYARVAVLVRPDDESNDFSVVVSQNAGLNVHLFRDRDEALEFLLRGS